MVSLWWICGEIVVNCGGGIVVESASLLAISVFCGGFLWRMAVCTICGAAGFVWVWSSGPCRSSVNMYPVTCDTCNDSLERVNRYHVPLLSNQVTGGTTAAYDGNGNQTLNTANSLSWNASAQPVNVNGVGATYDPMGRMVETNASGTYTQYVYTPSGNRLATVQSGQLVSANIPLPGGGTAMYKSTGFNYFRHSDWLGSSRLATTWAHSVYSKEAYAPF